MLNLTPNSTNNLIIYADTVSAGTSVGNFFTIVFTNSYSKQTFSVAANVVRRNTRFVELEVNLVGVSGLNNPINGDIYLYPEGNFEYMVFNTNAPTITFESPLSCSVWSTEEAFWNFAQTVWNVCAIQFEQIDRGQAFLYATDPCQHEVEFVPYTGGNEILDAIVYVTGVPLFQFPCTIPSLNNQGRPTQYVLEQTTTTYCMTITIEDGASLIVPNDYVLTQTAAPFGYC
jgi:hypothetical protein